MTDPGYIYVGGYYHYSGKDISSLTEKKVGKSINVPSRENALNSTKFTIGYTMIKYWQVDSMSRVEKMLHAILPERMQGEWFEDTDGMLVERVSKFMDIYGASEQNVNPTELEPAAVKFIASNKSRDRVAELAGQTFTQSKNDTNGNPIKVSFTVNADGTFTCHENGKTYDTSPHSAFCELWANRVTGEAKTNVWTGPRNENNRSMDQELSLLKPKTGA